MSRPFFSTLPLRPLALLLALTVGLTAEEPAQDFRLFVGVDLMLKNDDNSYRRIDSLKGDEVILDEPDHPMIPVRKAGAFSWEHKTKLSRAPVTIADFEQHRVFSLRNDKAMQYMNSQNNMAIYQQEKADAARLAASDARFTQQIMRKIYVDQELDKESRAGLEGGPPAGYVAGGREGLSFTNVLPDDGYFQTGANLQAANEAVEQAEYTLNQELLDTTMQMEDSTFLDRMQGAASEGGQDVMELEFTLASPDPIANAYVVIMGAIAQGDEDGVITFHQPVGAIGPEPRKIKIRKTGFQPGFKIKEVKIHVYAYGKELGTNLSDRAVKLTLQQAREFLLLSHIADHAVESVPPTPVWNLAPPALLAAKSRDSFNYPVVVNIDADGSVISIHNSVGEARAYLDQIHDASDLRSKATPGKSASSLSSSVRVTATTDATALDQTGRLPPQVVAAMRDMFFLPALDTGAPIAGTTQVNLADFFR